MPTALPSFNVPVKIVGWAEDGGAKVELLVDVPALKLRASQTIVARVRYDPKKTDQNQITFTTYSKKGLRTGGIVLLRKLIRESATLISARSLDVLLESPKYGQTYLSRGAAVSLLPPPPGRTMLVTEGYVAMLEHAVAVKKLKAALEEQAISLDLARTFGQPGLILTGEDEAGAVSEYIVGGTEGLSTSDIVTSLSVSIDPGLSKWMERSKKDWYLVPYFKTKVDPDPNRVSKISAQRTNVDYGAGDDLSWTVCNCILRNPGDGWLICDTTPITDDVESALLLDILEQ